MTTRVFTDEFTGSVVALGSHTPDLGGAWGITILVGSGTTEIDGSGNFAHWSASGGHSVKLVPGTQPTLPDVTISTSLNTPPGYGNYAIKSIALRVQGNTDQYYAAWQSYGANFHWVLHKYVGGVDTTVATSAATYLGGSLVTFSAIGSNPVVLTVVSDGVTAVTYSDAGSDRITAAGDVYEVSQNLGNAPEHCVPQSFFYIDQNAASAPSLTSVSPSSGVQGNTVAVTLTGTNMGGSTPSVSVSGSNVTVSSLVQVDAVHWTANFVIGGAAATGARTVSVTTADGTSGTQTFTVNSPSPPTLTTCAPTFGIRNSTQPVALTGTGFSVSTPTVAVSGSGVVASNIAVINDTSMTCDLAIDSGATASVRTVTVTTTAGTSGTQNFTVQLRTAVAGAVPCADGTPFGQIS